MSLGIYHDRIIKEIQNPGCKVSYMRMDSGESEYNRQVFRLEYEDNCEEENMFESDNYLKDEILIKHNLSITDKFKRIIRLQ